MKPVMKVKISIDAAMTLALLLLTMLGSMVSGVIVSRYVFPFQAGFGLTSWAEKLHMLCAYWGFCSATRFLRNSDRIIEKK